MYILYVCNAESTMNYISTTGAGGVVSLSEAVVSCVARDGGLYLPERIPELPKAFMKNMSEMSLRDIAFVVANSFFDEDVPASALKKIVDEAFAFDAPLVEVAPDRYVLELFHGPTLTVKDYGARFMSRLLKHLSRPGEHRNIIVATTGNTGAAVAASFHNMEGTDVFVLYPRGRLSRPAVAQFTSLGANIHPVEVAGSIEDCKRMLEQAISDPALSSARIIGANSINIARLLPMAALAFHAYSRLGAMGVSDAENALYATPCGNLSCLVGAVISRKMGLPMGGIVGGYNINSTLGSLLDGTFNGEIPAPTATFSPAIDMSYPSGWPRLNTLYKGDLRAASTDIIRTQAIDDASTANIVNTLHSHGYAIDTHGAVAWAAAEFVDSKAPRVIFATGHPAKQLDIMTRITGAAIELPVQLTRFMSVKRQPTKIAPTLPALRKLILTVNS